MLILALRPAPGVIHRVTMQGIAPRAGLRRPFEGCPIGMYENTGRYAFDSESAMLLIAEAAILLIATGPGVGVDTGPGVGGWHR